MTTAATRSFTTEELASLPTGEHLGHSTWHGVPQSRIDMFAEATGDHQWIHTDQAAAAEGPFGGTIAHGFLTLSLLPLLTSEVYDVTGVSAAVNHRVDKVRFRSPVPAGARVRAGVDLVSVRPRPRGYTEVTVKVAIELEDGGTACTCEQTTLYRA
ncbi:MaoC family dehydratase [Streptomyces wuyuanensis]|uniref:MaoC family dehydratase n=1 Tax=Streptomyces wuyuanensis TaxID=1196353 RepID=UPI00341B8F96